MDAQLPVEKRPYGVREPMPGTRLFHGLLLSLPDFAQEAFAALHRNLSEDFVGLTTDGSPRVGLVAPATGPSTRPITEAALAYLDDLSRPDQRTDAVVPFNHPHRRWWFNAFPDWVPSGLLLDDLTQPERDRVMTVVERTLSQEGYQEVRNVMRLNGLLGDFVNTYVDSLREWTYFFTIFGTPSEDAPWAWQLMGHHLDLNCLVLPDHVELTPMFLGSEFNNVEGVTVFTPHADEALMFARDLSEHQQQQAVLFWTMDTARLPSELAGPVDGRHLGGAGRDNIIVPYAGIAAAALTASQRDRLMSLVDHFLGRLPEAQRRQRRSEVLARLDETYFAWIGDPAAGAPFYYRIHGPTLWIEFDHHQGIFLDNDLPEPYHVHTIIRTPNGGDYGAHLVPLPTSKDAK
ncbi:MAG TPA: DUF3500 domain-containing protein [Baekduia sp.]|nr:DUF3500 domain-containing protein [Baekduia sp.]